MATAGTVDRYKKWERKMPKEEDGECTEGAELQQSDEKGKVKEPTIGIILNTLRTCHGQANFDPDDCGQSVIGRR